MDQTRTQQRYGSAGIPGAAEIPGGAPLVPSAEAPTSVVRLVSGVIGRWLASAALVLGVVYVAFGVTLAVGVPALNRVAQRPVLSRATLDRRLAADQMRPFALTKDPAITADAAGLAYVTLGLPTRRAEIPGFVRRRVDDRPSAPWRSFDLSPLAFRSGVTIENQGPNSYRGPNRKTILAAAAKGLPRDELALLRRYGTAEVWAVFDRVARAPGVDFAAGAFQLPFGPDATAYSLPAPSLGLAKELATASVARAAWHLAEGRRDSAEAALRAAVSVGFQLIDNGSDLISELVGAVVVGIGRDGLAQLYAVTRDPRLEQVEAAQRAVSASARSGAWQPWVGGGPQAEAQAQMLSFLASGGPTTAERMETLLVIPQATCTTTSGILKGHSPAVAAAFDAARRDYAGLPGRLAVLDLYESQLDQPLSGDAMGVGDPPMRIARMISRAYFSRRLANCALIALARR